VATDNKHLGMYLASAWQFGIRQGISSERRRNPLGKPWNTFAQHAILMGDGKDSSNLLLNDATHKFVFFNYGISPSLISKYFFN
jgi:hypothetical protein